MTEPRGLTIHLLPEPGKGSLFRLTPSNHYKEKDEERDLEKWVLRAWLAGISQLLWKPASSSHEREQCVHAVKLPLLLPGICANELKSARVMFLFTRSLQHSQQPRQGDRLSVDTQRADKENVAHVYTATHDSACCLWNITLSKTNQISKSKLHIISPSTGSNC